jgi:thiamine-phosphate pyrophosphorylase
MTIRRFPRTMLHGMYALVDPAAREPFAYIAALADAGIRLFQIRAKSGLPDDLLTALVAAVRRREGIAILNDDVARAVHADGVHLGQEDAAGHDLTAVRSALGGRIIGLSCGTPAEARAADPACVDYLGAGPIFATRSKRDAGRPIGVSGVRAVVDATPLPVAAIGGIDLARLPRVRESGAVMAAVISAFDVPGDVAANARAFVTAWR